MKTFEERFWAKVDKDSHSPCWIWTAHCNAKGYGQFGKGKKVDGLILAHRASWLIHKGKLSADKLICHTCDTPACVNPAHLFEGTHADNASDMVNKGRQSKGKQRNGVRRGEDNNKSKLTSELVQYARAEVANGRSRRSVARELGVYHSTIIRLVKGKTWECV